MANASENIAGVFRNADLIFPDVTDSQGSVHPLTDATFVPLLTSPDRELRRRAFETYYKQLGQYKNTIAATLDGQFKQLCFFANARHYDSTIQASLDATEVPRACVHEPHRGRPQQSGQDVPLCGPAQEAAGRGRAAHVRCVHPHCGRRRPGHHL